MDPSERIFYVTFTILKVSFFKFVLSKSYLDPDDRCDLCKCKGEKWG